MKTKRWYFKNNYEDYNILHEDNSYILVQNINSGKYSFGIISDFGSFYGFPVDQSCLTKNECIERLKRFIKIDSEYINKVPNINDNIKTWKIMVERLKAVV